MPVKITACNDKKIIAACAELMCTSEPWITLKRGYEQCLQAFEGKYRDVYIAKDNDKLSGFIILQMQGTFKGYIQSVAVVANARGKGIGTKLIGFAEKKIFAISPNAFMCVSSFNEQAQKLYLKLGYEKIGVLKNFLVKGHDEILLRKTTGALTGFAPWSTGVQVSDTPNVE